MPDRTAAPRRAIRETLVAIDVLALGTTGFRLASNLLDVLRHMTPKRLSLLATVVVLLVGCQSGRDATIPDELVGVWKTPDGQYADRFFEITTTAIIFGVGGWNIELYPIAAVERARAGDAILYTIVYRDKAGQEYLFRIRLESKGGVIRWNSKREIEWTKERPPS